MRPSALLSYFKVCCRNTGTSARLVSARDMVWAASGDGEASPLTGSGPIIMHTAPC